MSQVPVPAADAGADQVNTVTRAAINIITRPTATAEGARRARDAGPGWGLSRGCMIVLLFEVFEAFEVVEVVEVMEFDGFIGKGGDDPAAATFALRPGVRAGC